MYLLTSESLESSVLYAFHFTNQHGEAVFCTCEEYKRHFVRLSFTQCRKELEQMKNWFQVLLFYDSYCLSHWLCCFVVVQYFLICLVVKNSYTAQKITWSVISVLQTYHLFFFFFVDRLLIGLLLCHVICRHWHIYLLKYHLYPLSFPHQTHKRYKSFQSCHQIPRWLGPRKNSLSVSWETATLLRLWGHWSSSIPRRGGRKETTVVWQGSQMKVSSVTWNGRLAPKTLRDEGGGPMALQLLPPRWEVGSRSWVGLSLQG